MPPDPVRPPNAHPGDKVAVVSPWVAAPGVAAAVHEQAMRRLGEITSLRPAAYPTARQVRTSPEERAAELNPAFADPQTRAVPATIGGEDQVTVVPQMDPAAVRADPRPFPGYSGFSDA